MTDITQCAGYLSLRAAVDKDYANDHAHQSGQRPFHNYQAKFEWTVERAKHYGEALGIDPIDILNAWEAARDYWYMNYYQDANQPKIEADKVRVFDTVEQLKASIGAPRFRCPACGGISSDAYICDSGIHRDGKPCDWKSFGLFGTLGKGIFVYVKESLNGHSIFMPVAWEEDARTKSN